MTRQINAHFIDGAWSTARSTEVFSVVNPATGEGLAQVREAGVEDVEDAVVAARRAFETWSRTPVEARLALLQRVKTEIAVRSDALAVTITREMGSPITFSRTAQIGLAMGGLEAACVGMNAIELEERLGSSLVRREPLGVVAAITPWNFPLHQIIAKVAPALAAGCAVVLKPSEVTPLDAMLLVETFEAAGAPPGVINLVLGGREVGAALVSHPGVDMISFTGSTRAGRAIGEIAGRALKKVALELGGKSANVVLDDADLATAIPKALGQVFINSGQVCAALSRLLVPVERLAEVEAIAAEAAKAWTLGDPMDPDTRLGPLATLAQKRSVQTAVHRALTDGARAVAGGGELDGAYVQPTVLTQVDPKMAIAQEETFGPVLCLIGYDDEHAAATIANDSLYGLSGGVWSSDVDRARAFAGRLRTGQVVLNGAALDLAAPFGGVKASGLGRENGRFGVEEYLSVKAVLGAF